MEKFSKLEKLALASAGVGAATTIGLTVATVNRFMGMPEDTMIEGKEVASLMVKCYSPIFIGMISFAFIAAKETYKEIKQRFGYQN